MRGKTVKELRKIARAMAGDDDALYQLYYREAKRIHKKVSRGK